MSWNKEKDILTMREMTNKGIFESKSGSRERGTIWQNIDNNLNNCKEFGVTAEADTQKRQSFIENLTKKAQKMRKKGMERFAKTRKRQGKDESDSGDKRQDIEFMKQWSSG